MPTYLWKLFRIALFMVSAICYYPQRALAGGDYDTDPKDMIQYSANLEHMRKIFAQRQRAMPRLHVVEAHTFGDKTKGASFVAYQFAPGQWSTTPEQRKSSQFQDFIKQRDLLEIFDATGGNPSDCAISAGAKPCGFDSGNPWINKVFFREQEVGEHLAWTDGVACISISQLKVSRDGKHCCYVVLTNFDENGEYAQEKYYAVLDGKRGPVVDKIGPTLLNGDGSALAFKALNGTQLIDYVLSSSAASESKAKTDMQALKPKWELDPESLNYMRLEIRRRWFAPRGTGSKKVTVQFLLHKDGSASHIQVVSSSGMPACDQEAIKTVKLAAPFRPLKPGSPDSGWIRVQLADNKAYFTTYFPPPPTPREKATQRPLQLSPADAALVAAEIQKLWIPVTGYESKPIHISFIVGEYARAENAKVVLSSGFPFVDQQSLQAVKAAHFGRLSESAPQQFWMKVLFVNSKVYPIKE